MSELVLEAFWLVWFLSIGLAISISRNSLYTFLAGMGLLLEAVYFVGVVSNSSINMLGVVLLGFIGAYHMIIGWKG